MSEVVATAQPGLAGKYQPYPEYKDSGISRLGNIPGHWQPKQLKRMASIKNGRDYKHVEAPEGFPVIGSGGQFTWSSEYIYNGESVLLGRKGTVDRPLYINGPFWTVDTMFYTKVLNIIPAKFLYYAALTIEFGLYSTNTALPSMTQEDLGNVHFGSPSYEEAENIAAFLDYEVTRIDRLIAKQQRLIELLKEKRQAVISHAVTKGLNPQAPMKDSGIEWLGQVPEHWRISQPRYLCHFVGGGTPSKDNPVFWNGNIPWVSPKDMKQDFVSDSIDNISEHAISESSVKLIPSDAVLMVVRGMILAHSVPVALTTVPVTINQDMKAMIVDSKRLNGEYWLRLLQGFKYILLDLTESSAHGTKCLRSEGFDKLSVPIPPLEEQIQIIEYMNSTLDRIDKLLLKANNLIGFAEERRTALISAAVTGKIDLRGWIPSADEVAA